MEPQQVVAQYLQLPADAQRVVADSIAYLDRRKTQPIQRLDIANLIAAGEGATMLPPLIISNTLASTSKNPFINPDVQGEKFAWNEPGFNFREWRRQIRERPKAQL